MSPKTPTRRSPPVLLLSMITRQMFTTGSEEWGIGSGDCGLRIADCGFMNLFNREREIKIESCINPQSAIRNPQSFLPTGSRANGFDDANGRCRANHARKLEPGGYEQRVEFSFGSVAAAAHHQEPKRY